MLLTVDISNSHITLGGYEKEKDGCLQENLSFMARLVTETQRTDDQYAVELQQILRLYHIHPHQIDDVILLGGAGSQHHVLPSGQKNNRKNSSPSRPRSQNRTEYPH